MFEIRFQQDEFTAIITENSSPAFDPIRNFLSQVLSEMCEPIAYMLSDDPNDQTLGLKTFTPLYNRLDREYAHLTIHDCTLKLAPLHFVGYRGKGRYTIVGDRRLSEFAKHDFFSFPGRAPIEVNVPAIRFIGKAIYETEQYRVVRIEKIISQERRFFFEIEVERYLHAVEKQYVRELSEKEYFAAKLKYGL